MPSIPKNETPEQRIIRLEKTKQYRINEEYRRYGEAGRHKRKPKNTKSALRHAAMTEEQRIKAREKCKQWKLRRQLEAELLEEKETRAGDDKPECSYYEVCLNIAAKLNKGRVCVKDCVNYCPIRKTADVAPGSNWDIIITF